jgi:hypothetical protein
LLDLIGPVDGFETRAVFERIPRDRLIEVTQQDQDSLFLGVSCDCHLDAFLWRTGQLVVDVIDGPKSGEPVVQPRLENKSNAVEADNPAELPDLLELRASTSFQSALTIELRDEPPAPSISATEVALIEGLARAASQGFLDAAVQETPSPNVVSDEIVKDEPEDLPGPPTFVGQPGVGISSAIDREFALLGNVLESVAGQLCLPADFFDISTWGDDSGFHVQVANLAERLAGEFGEEPREAQDDLARLYIHFGFGAEARAVLSADMAQSQNRQILLELAGIVDEYLGSYDLIASQAGCPTPAALWAFYVNPTFLAEEERNHLLQQFFALPQPLRGQIAPRMARKFLAVDDTDAASKLIRASENQDAEVTHDVQATRALIAEEVDDPIQALEVLSQEAGDNARTTPGSVIRLIELALEQGQIPQQSDQTLVASMRQEYRDLPISDDLAIAEAKGLIATGQYRNALTLLQHRQDTEAAIVTNKAFVQLAQIAPAALFLEFAFDDIPEVVNGETKNEISRRLIDIGFPERATVLMSGLVDGNAAAERRFLRAQADIDSGNYTDAVEELLGMTDPRTQSLLVQAYAGLGEHRAALEVSSPETSNVGEEILQFRAGAWEGLTTDEDETLASFAAAILAPTIEDPTQSLADRREILTQSQESRRAIEGLLLRFDGVSDQE